MRVVHYGIIRRAAFVDANALLKDECGVEYKKPSQVQCYALFKDHDDSKAIEELYPDYAKDYDSCQGVAEAMIYDWMNNASKTD